MAEAISRRLLIGDFWAGWAVRLWFTAKVRCLDITELPRYKTRRLGQTAGGIVHEDAESERFFEAPDAATRQLLAEEGRRLQTEIDTLRDWRRSLFGQRRGTGDWRSGRSASRCGGDRVPRPDGGSRMGRARRIFSFECALRRRSANGTAMISTCRP